MYGVLLLGLLAISAFWNFYRRIFYGTIRVAKGNP